MAIKGSITKSNFIDYDKAMATGRELMKGRNKTFGFYIIVAVNTGLRIGDILNLKKEHFENGGSKFREQKTKKAKDLRLNDKILKAYEELKPKLNPRSEEVFTSQKGTLFTKQQINRKLKQHFQTRNKNVSSHSLRKGFGRKVYENNNSSDRGLLLLSQIFNHSAVNVTRNYLDISQEEITDVYMSL
jgi:integrase